MQYQEVGRGDGCSWRPHTVVQEQKGWILRKRAGGGSAVCPALQRQVLLEDKKKPWHLKGEVLVEELEVARVFGSRSLGRGGLGGVMCCGMHSAPHRSILLGGRQCALPGGSSRLRVLR